MIHATSGLGVTSTQPRIKLNWAPGALQAAMDAANAKRAAQLALESQGGVGGLPTIAWFVIGAAVVGGASWYFWLRK